MSTTLADLESWIDKLMTQKGIPSYKLDVSGSTTKGDGYLGEVNFVKVISNLGSSGEKTFHLVVKSAKKSDEFRKQTPIKEAYDRETFMYTKVLPIFLEFQKDCGLEKYFYKFPKCYSVCSEDKREALILENLKTAGYEIHDRKVSQNLKHALFVFRNYGKFHAISLALRHRKPALFRSLTKNMTDVMGRFIIQTGMIPAMSKDFLYAISALKANGGEHLAEKFKGFEDGLKEYLTTYSEPNSLQSVILHGDCWNNNIMFKYEDGNKNQPVGMCFIDFQLSRVGSPVFDLSYYLYTCTDKEVLRYFDFLLQAYYSSLSDFLKELGCNAEDILTFKELKGHWKKYGKYGLSLAPFILKIVLCDSDEVVDFADSAEKGGFKNAFDFQLKERDLYDQRLVDVLTHFAEKFL